jgi:predicted signal transduction protein with EAL and GGDEF domain
LTDVGKPEDASRLADKIAEAIAVPLSVRGHQIVLELNIGIALAPNDGSDSELLLGNAILALQSAKAEGRDARCFFAAEMNAGVRQRRLLKSDLRKALAAERFEILYQPLFNLSDGAISGFEALLRWHHPERGLISPTEFIPLAEEAGIIVQLGEWVLREACHEAASWPGRQKIAVNISPVQFRSPRLMQGIFAALASCDAGASARAGNYRNCSAQRRQGNSRSPPRAQERRHPDQPGRLWHRTFQSRLFAEISVRQIEDRPLLRARSRQ